MNMIVYKAAKILEAAMKEGAKERAVAVSNVGIIYELERPKGQKVSINFEEIEKEYNEACIERVIELACLKGDLKTLESIGKI
jgi:hypothetical protein